MSELNKTPLFDRHQSLGAKMVPFHGWAMPLHYGSQLKEHQYVRQNLGIFDVSHMTIIDVNGAERLAFLRYLLANDVAKLRVIGQAQYTLMLNEAGGIIDDLIVYYMADRFRVVVNSSTRQTVIDWMTRQARQFAGVTLTERIDLAMIAVQGPMAREQLSRVLGSQARDIIMELLAFTSDAKANWQIARTGYTGEDGVEIILPAAEAVGLWDTLIEAGIKPCGLGARDTLRLEAGLNLYGQDMDETTSPLESGLGWVLALDGDREFLGKSSLLAQKNQGVRHKFIGVLLEDKGILRSGYELIQSDKVIGQLTSGSFSPTLEASIGLARVQGFEPEKDLFVKIRRQVLPVQALKPPFYKQGKVIKRPLYEPAQPVETL